MRISFIWDWEPEYYQSITWQDGLAGAVKELIQRGHEVQVLCAGDDSVIKHPYFDILALTDIQGTVAKFAPDVILHWADLTRPNAQKTFVLGIPQALCFAGGETNGTNLQLFDHIFVESEVYKKAFTDLGKSVSTAFGTNTEVFKPMEQPKLFDTIFPATFARWKRHELYAKATNGLRSLACGYIYNDHEQDCWEICLENNVTILPHVSAETLKYLYAASKVCVIPSLSSGGSQRTVLEAMAMNIPVIVTDSDKFDFATGHVIVVEPYIPALRNAIEEALDTTVSTREYILHNWSEVTYADALEEGLKKLL